MLQFSAPHYRLPLLPSAAESTLAFSRDRTNFAVTVAFNDALSERKSEIFLSKIKAYGSFNFSSSFLTIALLMLLSCSIIDMNTNILDTINSGVYSQHLNVYGIGRRTFNSLRRIVASISAPSTGHESFWTASYELEKRAINELRTFLASMNAPFDPVTAFNSSTYLNIRVCIHIHYRCYDYYH